LIARSTYRSAGARDTAHVAGPLAAPCAALGLAAACILLTRFTLGRQTAVVVGLCAAFHVGLAGFLWLDGRPEDAPRAIAGLALAAACGHLGWVAMHWPGLDGALALAARPAGATVLFAPVGIWLSAPRLSRGRAAYLHPAMAALPLALAVARLSCLAGGCCQGARMLEIAGCVLLGALSQRLRRDLTAPAVVAGLSAIRLAAEPLRAPDPFAPPVVPVAGVAGALLGAAALGLARARRDVR